MIVTLKPVLETYNFEGRMWRHPLAYGRSWSSFYGAEGGGFGSLTWKEDRAIGHDYNDVGFLFPVVLRKGLCNVLFDGVIVQIQENKSASGDTITCTAVGWGAFFSFDRYNKVYKDARPGEWKGYSRGHSTYVPDKFDIDTQSRLYIRPRKGVDFLANEYSYLRYVMPFDRHVSRVRLHWDLALPYSWPGRLELRDSTGVLFYRTATGSGDSTVLAGADADYMDMRFYVTAAGENTAGQDTVYGKLEGAVVIGEAMENISAQDVANDLVDFLAGRGISSSHTRVEDPGTHLPSSVVFAEDWTPKEILNWVCQFGGSNGTLLAWGVTTDTQRKIYLETQDLSTIRWMIEGGSIEASAQADATQSAQKMYAVYRDQDNQVQRTADVLAQMQIDELGGNFIRAALRVDGSLDSKSVDNVLAMELDQAKNPKAQTSFSVTGQVLGPGGKAKAADEVKAGGVVAVKDFRSRETQLASGDARTQWTSFQLVGVEYDEESRTVRMTPGGDRRKLETFLARMKQEVT